MHYSYWLILPIRWLVQNISLLDLNKSYHQLEVAPGYRHKTAMTTPLGSYEYNKLSMGLGNSSLSLIRFMNKIFRGLSNVSYYVDDVLIFSKTCFDHLAHLTAVFDRLLENGLVLN